jgi:hypothetical protein
VYRVRTWVSSRAVLLEVGAARDDVRKTDESVALHHKADAGSLRPVDAYTVNKRWGFEVWSTPNPTFAEVSYQTPRPGCSQGTICTYCTPFPEPLKSAEAD